MAACRGFGRSDLRYLTRVLCCMRSEASMKVMGEQDEMHGRRQAKNPAMRSSYRASRPDVVPDAADCCILNQIDRTNFAGDHATVGGPAWQVVLADLPFRRHSLLVAKLRLTALQTYTWCGFRRYCAASMR